MATPSRDFKWRRFPPLQLVVYVFVRAVIAVAHMFTYRYLHRIGRLAGKVGYVLDVKHRRIAEKNVFRAEGMPKEPAAVARFVRRVYEHMGLLSVETLMLPRLMACHDVERYVKLEGGEKIEALLKEGKGVILVVAHLGNWELAGQVCALAGMPIHIIARPVENPLFNDYLTRTRTKTGAKLIIKYGAFAEAGRLLKTNQVVAVLADQDARKGGVFVPFFGRPASTVRSPALLALKFGAPIVLGRTYRVGRNRHLVRIEETIRPGRYETIDQGVAELTAAFTSRLEAFIREQPEQWMWLHARWKTKPAGTASDELEVAASRDLEF